MLCIELARTGAVMENETFPFSSIDGNDDILKPQTVRSLYDINTLS